MINFNCFITWLGLTVAVSVVSVLLGFIMSENLKNNCNIGKYEYKIWLFGTAWVVSTVIAGVLGTCLMINS